MSRILVVAVAPLGVVLAELLPSGALVLGIAGGLLAGSAAGIALVRRRISHDDELLIRQEQRGYDPENPWGWMRGEG